MVFARSSPAGASFTFFTRPPATSDELASVTQPAVAPPGSFQAGWTPVAPREEYAPRDVVARHYGASPSTTYAQQYPSAPPSHGYSTAPPQSMSIHTKTQSASYFHPYQQKPRPLLFINTILPPSAPVGPLASELIPAQVKPKRKRISPEQLDALTALFEQTDSPSFDVRERLGAQLNMSNREVQVSLTPCDKIFSQS